MIRCTLYPFQLCRYSKTGRLLTIDRGLGVKQNFKVEVTPFGSIASQNSLAGRTNSIERHQEGSEIKTTITGGKISTQTKYFPEDGSTEEVWPDGTKVCTRRLLLCMLLHYLCLISMDREHKYGL